jgi:WD40 repeat protein
LDRWDAEALKKVRTLSGHSARVGALSWNNQWLSSGGRDSVIIQHDVRSSNNVAATYTGHTQEVRMYCLVCAIFSSLSLLIQGLLKEIKSSHFV